MTVDTIAGMNDMSKTILMVDDDVDFLAQMSVRLKAAGFDIITANSVKQAHEILAKQKPDLAIVDLMMENLDDGFTLSHDIKRMDANIPVILVTGVASETGMDFHSKTKEERSWIKADVVLDKPILFEQLQREISRLLGL